MVCSHNSRIVLAITVMNNTTAAIGATMNFTSFSDHTMVSSSLPADSSYGEARRQQQRLRELKRKALGPKQSRWK